MGAGSPRRTEPGGPHHLMRDLENLPTHSMFEVSGTGSDGGLYDPV